MTQPLGPKQEAWMRDLETTEARQGRGKLCNPTAKGFEFCCLGRAGVSLGKAPSELVTRVLPEELAKELGFKQPERQFSFWALNDSENLSFKQIAARIRANPTDFFSEPK